MSFNKVNDDAPKLTTFGVIPTLPFEFPDLPKFKIVNFFGLPVAVPKGFKWLALDDNGDVYAYRKKPYFDCGDWHVKDKHTLPFNEHECIRVYDLLNILDEVTDEQAEKSRIRVKDLPRYYP